MSVADWHEDKFMMVTSFMYEGLDEPSHYFNTAQAYIESSLFLFHGMVNDELHRTFYHAKVAVFLFIHSIELFLKGAILQAGEEPTPKHALEQIYNQYRKLYPGKAFLFEGSIEEAIAKPKQDIDEYQFLRYPTDRYWDSWPGDYMLLVNKWGRKVEEIYKDYLRLRPLITDKNKSAGEKAAHETVK